MGRDLEQREFYAFGPALGKSGVVHFRSDQLSRHVSATWPTSSAQRAGAIASDVLDKFADLPQEAEDKIRGLITLAVG